VNLQHCSLLYAATVLPQVLIFLSMALIHTTQNRRSKPAWMGCRVIEWVLPDILKNGIMFVVMVKECKICPTAWKCRWKHYNPSKRFEPLIRHGITTENTWIFNNTAV